MRPARRRPIGARFSIPEVELGIPLAWGGIPRLVREIGPALTKELVMTCREFGPDEAQAAGFLNRVVDDDQLDAAVDELVATLVRMPKLALLATKVHTNAVTESMVATGRSWSDADGLLAGLRDPEGRASSRRVPRAGPREAALTPSAPLALGDGQGRTVRRWRRAARPGRRRRGAGRRCGRRPG